MPLDVLLKNYDNDVRDLLEKQLTTSHLRLVTTPLPSLRQGGASRVI